MKKYKILCAMIGALLCSSSWGQKPVIINGQLIAESASRVEIMITEESYNIQITTAQVGSITPPPEVVDPVIPEQPSACVPSAYQRCGVINWDNPGPRILDSLVGTDQVVSWKFATGNFDEYAGTISVSEHTSANNTIRRVWISRQPGGDTADGNFRCETQGVSQRNINWSQKPNRFRCSLDTNTTYYLNITNVDNCGANQECGFYRSIITN